MPNTEFVQKHRHLVAVRGLMLASCLLLFGGASVALAQGQLTRLHSVADAHISGQPAFVVDFGSVEVGFLRTLGIGYANIGAGPITNIVVGELHGNDPEVFLIVQDNCTGVELAPGENCTIFLRFEPPASGDYSADFIVTSSAPGSPELVRLLGSGIIDGIFSDRFEDTGQGFFVDSENGDDSTGSFETGAPFATVQAAVEAAPVGATIVVRPGSYPGTIDLKDGQQLVGAGFENINHQGEVKPLFTGPINLADGNTLRGLRIEGTSTGHAIEGSNSNGGTISHCDVANTVLSEVNIGTGIEIRPGTGTWTITNNTFVNTRGGIFVRIDGNNEATFRINDNFVSGSPFIGIVLTATQTSVVRLQLHRNHVLVPPLGPYVIQAVEAAQLCLDLEDNESGGTYRLVRELGTVFNIEQLDVLTVPKALGGAGNTGTVSIADAVENAAPTNVIDGFCGF